MEITEIIEGINEETGGNAGHTDAYVSMTPNLGKRKEKAIP